MSSDLKDLLDDAATAALGSRSLDARGLLEQGRARHRRALVNRAAAGLAVAAALVLGLLLAPARWVAPQQPARPTSGPVGLPRSLPLPTPWTPTVAQSPIERASMLLTLGDPGSDWGDGDVTLVLSADGTAYRRLPDDTAAATLTDDGRHVVYRTGGGAPGRPPAALHLLRLADGLDRTVTLPNGQVFSEVDRLVLTPDSRTVYAVGSDGSDGTASDAASTNATWVMDIATGRVSRSSVRPFLITRTGKTFAAPGTPARRGQPAPLPAAFDPRGTGRTLSSPDGRQLATYAVLLNVEFTPPDQPYGFVIGAPDAKPLVVPFMAPAGVTFAGGVEWVREGILFRWDQQLRLFDPVTRQARVVVVPEQPPTRSDQGPGGFAGYDVAYDVVQAGGRVPGVTHQDEPPWVVRLVRSPSGVRGEAVAVVVALALAAALLLVRGPRLRRRAASRPPH